MFLSWACVKAVNRPPGRATGGLQWDKWAVTSLPPTWPTCAPTLVSLTPTSQPFKPVQVLPPFFSNTYTEKTHFTHPLRDIVVEWHISARLQSFSVLSKLTSTCSQEKPGIEPLTLAFLDDCSTNWSTFIPEWKSKSSVSGKKLKTWKDKSIYIHLSNSSGWSQTNQHPGAEKIK